MGRCRSLSRSTCRWAASTRCCARRKSSPSNSDYKYGALVSSYDQFAFDISCGMAFVHGLPQPIMHRDLKAANVLVSDKLVAKVVSLCVVCVTPGGRRYGQAMRCHGAPTIDARSTLFGQLVLDGHGWHTSVGRSGGAACTCTLMADFAGPQLHAQLRCVQVRAVPPC